MREQLGEVAGRFVWGHPNTDKYGCLIRESNCCIRTHWTPIGWIRWRCRSRPTAKCEEEVEREAIAEVVTRGGDT